MRYIKLVIGVSFFLAVLLISVFPLIQAKRVLIAADRLPFHWQTRDIGFVRRHGSVSYRSGTFAITGSGSDIWDRYDRFRYVYQAFNGDGLFVAHVTSQTGTADWAKAGIMMRESLNSSSKNILVAVTHAHGITCQWRDQSGGTSSYTNVSSLPSHYWLELIRHGDTFTGWISSDGYNWTMIAAINMNMSRHYYIGLAVTSHNQNSLSTVTFTDVNISRTLAPTPSPITPTPTPVTPTPVRRP